MFMPAIASNFDEAADHTWWPIYGAAIGLVAALLIDAGVALRRRPPR
jgi:hypothetical protein